MSEKTRKMFAEISNASLENAKAWLMRAQQAKDSGPVGHSFSMAVTANEELAKSYVSWLVSVGLLHPEHEFVLRIFDRHEVKHMFMIHTYMKDDLSIALAVGIIDTDDLLSDALTMTESDAKVKFEEYVQLLTDLSIELEDLRRDGIYVDIWKEDDGTYISSNPEQFSSKKRDNMLTLVEGGLDMIGGLLNLFQKDSDVEKNYIKFLRERRKGKPWEWL